MMLKGLDEVNEFVKHARTTKSVEIVNITDIMSMDKSGDGKVDLNEYIVYMLHITGQIDPHLLDGLAHQFKALDATGNGFLELDE